MVPLLMEKIKVDNSYTFQKSATTGFHFEIPNKSITILVLDDIFIAFTSW